MKYCISANQYEYDFNFDSSCLEEAICVGDEIKAFFFCKNQATVTYVLSVLISITSNGVDEMGTLNEVPKTIYKKMIL